MHWPQTCLWGTRICAQVPHMGLQCRSTRVIIVCEASASCRRSSQAERACMELRLHLPGPPLKLPLLLLSPVLLHLLPLRPLLLLLLLLLLWLRLLLLLLLRLHLLRLLLLLRRRRLRLCGPPRLLLLAQRLVRAPESAVALV
mgnify:CR=1 FL=1